MSFLSDEITPVYQILWDPAQFMRSKDQTPPRWRSSQNPYGTADGSEIRWSSWCGQYLIIYKVLAPPKGGWPWEPSTVVDAILVFQNVIFTTAYSTWIEEWPLQPPEV